MLGHLIVFGDSLEKIQSILGRLDIKLTLMRDPYTIPEDCTGMVILNNWESATYFKRAFEIARHSGLPCAIVKDYKCGVVLPTLLMMGVLDPDIIKGTNKIDFDCFRGGEKPFTISIDPAIVNECAAGYLSVQHMLFRRVPSRQEVEDVLSKVFPHNIEKLDLAQARLISLDKFFDNAGSLDTSPTPRFADDLIKGRLRFNPPPPFKAKVVAQDDPPDPENALEVPRKELTPEEMHCVSRKKGLSA